MKKIAITVFVFGILMLVSIYFSIPGNIRLSKIVAINCTTEGANRFLSQKNNWKKLWPGGNYHSYSDQMIYKSDTFQIINRLRNSIELLIHHHNLTLQSTIEILPLSTDSSTMEWHCTVVTGLHPLKRIERFRQARHIKRIMTEIMQAMKSFLEKKENVYGISIKEEKVKDTLLIVTKSSSNSYPTTSTIYNLIKSLKDYISSNGATETNYPMLNVTKDSGDFKIMVAIPVNTIIPQNNQFLFKRMVPGRIIVTEVKGSNYTIDKAFNELEIYLSDHNLSSPAIPFESLITDRSTESDTTKWVTKIYYPIY
jgi:effector-binding domain-containing protein